MLNQDKTVQVSKCVHVRLQDHIDCHMQAVQVWKKLLSPSKVHRLVYINEDHESKIYRSTHRLISVVRDALSADFTTTEILKARRGNEKKYVDKDQLHSSGLPYPRRQHDLIRRLSRCRAQHTLQPFGHRQHCHRSLQTCGI